MSDDKARIVRCPTCDKPAKTTAQNPWRPFCSERCKLIDLGDWAGERHRIADENTPVPPGSEESDI
jgi:endogenous inhibitor of DNA gyrase (YacG/DUF329 family)